jgi:hypothetical protein
MKGGSMVWFLLGVTVALCVRWLVARLRLASTRDSAWDWAQAIARAQARLNGEREAFKIRHPQHSKMVKGNRT